MLRDVSKMEDTLRQSLGTHQACPAPCTFCLAACSAKPLRRYCLLFCSIFWYKDPCNDLLLEFRNGNSTLSLDAGVFLFVNASCCCFCSETTLVLSRHCQLSSGFQQTFFSFPTIYFCLILHSVLISTTLDCFIASCLAFSRNRIYITQIEKK